MSRHFIFFCFFVFQGLNIYAQNPCKSLNVDSTYQFGQDIDLKGLPIEKTDRILLRSEDIDFYEAEGSIEVVIRRHEIKRIGNSNPYSRIVNIPYYAKNRVEQVLDLRGFTHTKDGRKIPLDTSLTRIIDLNDRYLSLEFVMPEADSGAVIEYAYSLRRSFIEELPDFFLQESVPINKAILRIHYPDFIRYAVQSLNSYGLELCKEIIKKDTSSIPPVFVYRRPPPLTTEIWQAKDIPALPEEQLAGNVDDLKAKIVMKMSEFGRPRQPLEISWDVVLAQYRKEQALFSVVNEWRDLLPDQLKRDWNKLSEEDRLVNIFEYVNAQVKLDLGFGIIPSDPKSILDKPIDQWSQADINSQLLAYLIEAGLDAKPVLAPIESIGRIQSGYPSPFKLNALLVYVEIGNKPIWLDASVPASFPNLLRRENIDKETILLEQRSHRWIRTSAAESLYGVEATITASLQKNASLNGTIVAKLRGYPAQMIRQKLLRGQKSLNLIRSLFFDAYNLVELDSVDVLAATKMQSDVQIRAQFEIPNYGIDFKDALDFRPLVVGYRFENPIEADSRSLPIKLDAPEYVKLQFDIDLSKAGLSHSMDDFNQNFTLPSGYLLENYRFEANSLHYEFETILSSREYDAKLFDRVNAIYQRWIDLSNTRWKLAK